MWTKLSLRTRISLLLCAMFLCAALLSLLLLRIFGAEQLRDENEAAGSAVASLTTAFNAALQSAPNPSLVLQKFVAAIPQRDVGAIEFRNASDDAAAFRSGGSPQKKLVPDWFRRFLDTHPVSVPNAVFVNGEKAGEIVFEPSMEADLYEKWVGFLVIAISAVALAMMTVAITYITVGAALRPLRELDRGLDRLREGDYSGTVVCTGPPEIHGSFTAANDLAKTLRAYDTENRSLLRQLITMQDDERRDLARELHDELGPLLFSIRANAVALMDSVPLSESPDHPSQRLVASVEALQSTNSRILDRLRPNDIDALGLSKSIEALIDRMRRDAPHLVIAAKIDPAIDALDPIVSQTIYRVVQESLTNVLRHSGAAKAWVDIACSDGSISIGIADDGVGLPHDLKAGRGLIGMRERSRAIGASFEITNRPSGGASLRWSMLAGEASDATQKTSRNSSSLSNSATSKG